ncbi:MAG: L,D-transpeptidase [Gammaproteobacteria bacterium]|nr:L,D-transpeptidase [Gammaproteobacteria bacterium]
MRKRLFSFWRTCQQRSPPPWCLTLGFAVALGLALPIVHADSADDVGIVANTTDYSLEIDKSARVLTLRQGTRIARTFPVALGRGGHGDKRIRGDNKTPIGVYYITGVNEGSGFDVFMRLSYPNVKDGYFGLKKSLISRPEFEHILDAQRQSALPPQNTALGGSIGIHGLGEETITKLEIQNKFNWTQGCIALTNRNVRELRRFVGVGTKVVIRE